METHNPRQARNGQVEFEQDPYPNGTRQVYLGLAENMNAAAVKSRIGKFIWDWQTSLDNCAGRLIGFGREQEIPSTG